jgi:hypothetical protein
MICRICGEDINEKGQVNVSPISGYPVCEDCKDDISCERCCSSCDALYYVEEWGDLLCEACLVEAAKKRELIFSATHYYTKEGEEIGADCDLEPVIDHLKEFLDIEEVWQ